MYDGLMTNKPDSLEKAIRFIQTGSNKVFEGYNPGIISKLFIYLFLIPVLNLF